MTEVLGIAGNKGDALRNDSYWEWARAAIQIWRSRHDKNFQTLMGMTPQKVIRFSKKVVRIAVVGDGGFQGQAQTNVIYRIRERHRIAPFDLVIHLGDVYFAGNKTEFLQNFIAPFKTIGPKVLTLLGNHDLYFGGDAYLQALRTLQQPGRYFSIVNPDWRIACLDTALPADKLLRNVGQLDEGQLNWLDLQLGAPDGRKTLLMSHHFIVSGWEKPSPELRNQLLPRLDRVFAWYWGHEHGCATYHKKTIGFHGACIGNGAFLEPRKNPSRQPKPDWYAKGSCSCYEEQSSYWPHGYLELELQPTQVVETYHVEGEKPYRRTLKR